MLKYLDDITWLFGEIGKGISMLFLLYPPRCPICDKVMDIRFVGICPSCRKKIPYATEPRCKKCGKSLLSEQFEYCNNCRYYRHDFTQARGSWLYKDPIKTAVYRFKNSNRRGYAPIFAEEMIRQNRNWLINMEIDLIVPIPLHKKKQRERGYNQAGLLADEIGKHLKIPVEHGLLVKKRETNQQKSLSRQKRKENLKDAFALDKKVKSGSTILLIDDVYTTGSTADAASQLLLKAGVGHVYVLCLCIGIT